MGCGSGKDIKASAGMAIQSTMVSTGMLEFDQIFLVLAQKLQEAEKVRLGLVPNHFNIIRIVKADHLAEPSIIDAYKLWLIGVSCCNKGQLKACKFEFNEEKNIFTAKLGTCGEYKFKWFAKYLNGFIESVSVAQKLFPQIKKIILEQFARIQGMKTDILKYSSAFPTMQDKMIASGKLGINVAQVALAVKICEEVEKNLVNYSKEIKVLQEQHSELEKQADVQGLKIYEKYGCIEFMKPGSNKLKLRMNYKMTELVHYYYDGTRRTAEEQNAATLIKTERAQNRPFRTQDYKPDDLPYKGNGVPYRIRWVGCAAIDNDMQFISMFLQEIDTQYSRVTLQRNLIRFRLNTYTLVDDQMIEAFKVFMWAYIKAKPEQTAFDEVTYKQILQAKGSKEDIEEVRLWMLEYCKYTVPSRAAYIQETYQDTLEKMKLLNQWAKGNFLKLPEFQSIKLEHQYNMMSNIAKNIHTLIEYQKLLPIFFIEVNKLLEEGKKVWIGGTAIMIEANKENGNCKDLEISKIVANVHKGAQKSDDALKDLKLAYQKLYDENKVRK